MGAIIRPEFGQSFTKAVQVDTTHNKRSSLIGYNNLQNNYVITVLGSAEGVIISAANGLREVGDTAYLGGELIEDTQVDVGSYELLFGNANRFFSFNYGNTGNGMFGRNENNKNLFSLFNMNSGNQSGSFYEVLNDAAESALSFGSYSSGHSPLYDNVADTVELRFGKKGNVVHRYDRGLNFWSWDPGSSSYNKMMSIINNRVGIGMFSSPVEITSSFTLDGSLSVKNIKKINDSDYNVSVEDYHLIAKSLTKEVTFYIPIDSNVNVGKGKQFEISNPGDNEFNVVVKLASSNKFDSLGSPDNVILYPNTSIRIKSNGDASWSIFGGSPSLSASNGLNKSGNAVKLGGDLTETTTVNLSSYDFIFGQSSGRSTRFYSDGGISLFGSVGTTTFNYKPGGYNAAASIDFSATGAAITNEATWHLRSSGSSNSSNAVMIKNFAGTQLFRLYDSTGGASGNGVEIGDGTFDNTTYIDNVGGYATIRTRGIGVRTSAQYLYISGGVGVGGGLGGANFNPSTPAIQFSGTFNLASPTQTQAPIGVTATFSPTSSSTKFAAFILTPTINQVGATGDTWGMYINPVLTSVGGTWRSIEWANNTGWGLYGSGTATNYLGGNLYVGVSAPTTAARLAVRGDGTNSIFRGETSAGVLMSNITAGGVTVLGNSASAVGTGGALYIVQSSASYSEGIRFSATTAGNPNILGIGAIGVGTMAIGFNSNYTTITGQSVSNASWVGSGINNGTVAMASNVADYSTYAASSDNHAANAWTGSNPRSAFSDHGAYTQNVSDTLDVASFRVRKGIVYTNAGSSIYTGVLVSPTINQTGTSTGIMRGVWVNPGLISVVGGWRSFETNNNTGFGFYSSGTALNYFNGHTGIGTTTPDIFSRSHGKILGIQAASGNAAIEISGASGSGGSIEMGAATTRYATIRGSSTGMELSTQAAIPITMYINGTAAFNLASTGDIGVGIGGVTPNARLHLRSAGTGSTWNTYLENGSAARILGVRDDGILFFGANASAPIMYTALAGTVTNSITGTNLGWKRQSTTVTGFAFDFNDTAQSAISASGAGLSYTGGITFSSTAFDYNSFSINLSNNTGGTYVGVTRGIYSTVNPLSVYNYKAFTFTSASAITPNAAITDYKFAELFPNINASVNNQVITGLDIVLSGSDGAFGGVRRYGLRVTGGSIFTSGEIIQSAPTSINRMSIQNGILRLIGGTAIGSDSNISMHGSTHATSSNLINYDASEHRLRTVTGVTLFSVNGSIATFYAPGSNTFKVQKDTNKFMMYNMTGSGDLSLISDGYVTFQVQSSSTIASAIFTAKNDMSGSISMYTCGSSQPTSGSIIGPHNTILEFYPILGRGIIAFDTNLEIWQGVGGVEKAIDIGSDAVVRFTHTSRGVVLPNFATDPGVGEDGEIYFNTALNTYRKFSSVTGWVNW